MPDPSRILKVAIPKGSLQEPTLELLAKAGYEVYVSSRGLRPSSNDPELDLYLIRAQEIGRYIGQGFLDCGITGYDWAYENEVDLIDLAELPYSRATTRPTRWVLVVPEDSPIRKPEDLEGKRIATEGVGITRRYLKERGIQAEVEFSWGATEVKVPDLVDAIVDVTETGSSIKANRLRIVDTLADVVPALLRQPGGRRGSLEKGEDGPHRPAAQSRAGCPRESGAQDESAQRALARTSGETSLAPSSHRFQPVRRRLAGRRDGD